MYKSGQKTIKEQKRSTFVSLGSNATSELLFTEYLVVEDHAQTSRMISHAVVLVLQDTSTRPGETKS